MAAAQQAPDRTDTVDIVDKSSIDVQENSVVGNTKQAFSTKNEETILSHDANDVDLLRNAPSQLGPLEAAGNQSDVYPPNIYAPQAQTVFYGGYESTGAEWEQYVNVEGMGVGSTGIYNENPSLVYHTGYGYNPQMPYGPYSPVATPLPNSSGDGQLYSPQHFPFTGQYYQQPATPSMYITSPTSVSQADLTAPVVQQGAFLAGNSNSNGMVFGSRPGYHLSYDSFGRGSSGGNSDNPGFYDLRQGFDVSRSGGYWSDWSKIPDGGGSLSPLSSPAASSHPISVVGSFGQNNMPLASGMASQQQRSFYGFGSLANSFNRGYSRSGMYQRGTSSGMSFPSLGNNSRSLNMFDKGRRQAKADASLCSCNGPTDFLTEQNRGPRATRPKKLTVENMASTDEKTEKSTSGPDRELYNKPDFAIEYEDAKFFIIKSYSEDNVHKSIKYGVWASTANGNRKLDSAYREAKERGHPCPIFLFFSVNASAQFCGVAEMIGPVDFEKSVDYWQQDKWSGQFPVKWYIVKDVSNNMLRHIILENNDNKPVTNSRDTQEVRIEQGLEMLSIFKQQESDLSILDDFDFYEERQKAMQERKALQHQQWTPPPSGVQFVDQLSTSFADSVRLEEINILGPATEATFSEPTTDRPEKADSPDSTVTESS